ncbi:uncharacterized protein LOC136759294 [Amia ocellicauda]|uniref:uncharacterized protein LOC136759294 n=1 Tax=Amia ocellicauda TaxID=2972642 RepID=UPI003463F2BE
MKNTEAQRTLFVRRQRLQSVGSFSLLLLHCLSHIATGELRHDSSPVFQRFFFQSVQACLNELFLLRLDGYGDAPSVRALRGALAGEASSGPATLSALSTLLQDRVQEPTLACLSEKRACEQLQKYREASIYRSVEGLLRERSVGVRKDYHRQAPLSAGSRSSSHTGSNPVDTLADSKEQSQASLGWLNRELSGLLSAEWQKGTMGVIPKEILLRDIERLERECGLGGE